MYFTKEKNIINVKHFHLQIVSFEMKGWKIGAKHL
jgi:hypothetical protein